MKTYIENQGPYSAWVMMWVSLTQAQYNYLLPAVCRSRLVNQGNTYGVLTMPQDVPDIKVRLQGLEW